MKTHDGPALTRVAAFARRFGTFLGWAAALGSLAWVGARAAPRVVAPATVVVAAATSSQPTAEPATVLARLPAETPSPPCKDTAHAEGGVLPDGRVVLNRAGVADLMQLPGVGEKRARAIVALRERVGAFRSLRDLLRVRGLGAKMLRRLEPKVVVDTPDAEASKPVTPVEVARKGA